MISMIMWNGVIYYNSYIKDIKDEVKTSKTIKHNNVDHPINALHVIRRFVIAWQEVFNQVGNFTNYNGKFMESTDFSLGNNVL